MLRAAYSKTSSRVLSQTAVTRMPVRFLNLHEYQSKELMAKYNVRVQRGRMAETAAGALEAAKWLKETNAKELVLKAQIHAGGR